MKSGVVHFLQSAFRAAQHLVPVVSVIHLCGFLRGEGRFKPTFFVILLCNDSLFYLSTHQFWPI